LKIGVDLTNHVEDLKEEVSEASCGIPAQLLS